jgi:hypothetical protein
MTTSEGPLSLGFAEELGFVARAGGEGSQARLSRHGDRAGVDLSISDLGVGGWSENGRLD